MSAPTWSRSAGIWNSSKALSHASNLVATVSTRVPSRSNSTAAGSGSRRRVRSGDRAEMSDDLLGVTVRRKHRIEDVLHLAVEHDQGQALQQRLAFELESWKPHGPGQLQARIGKQLERQLQPVRGLLLIGRVLRAYPEDFSSHCLELGELVAESARLGRAPAGTWNRVPACRNVSVGTPGPRVEVQHGSPAPESSKVKQT